MCMASHSLLRRLIIIEQSVGCFFIRTRAFIHICIIAARVPNSSTLGAISKLVRVDLFRSSSSGRWDSALNKTKFFLYALLIAVVRHNGICSSSLFLSRIMFSKAAATYINMSCKKRPPEEQCQCFVGRRSVNKSFWRISVPSGLLKGVDEKPFHKERFSSRFSEPTLKYVPCLISQYMRRWTVINSSGSQ